MTPALERLVALQALDLRGRALAGALAALPAREQAAAQRVAAAGATRTRHREELRAHEMARRAGEREADALAAEERRYQAQTARVKTNDELKALQHEIDVARQRRSQIETAVLEQLELEEAESTRAPALEQAIADAEAVQRAEGEAIAAERERLRADAAALAFERDALAAQVPAEFRARYDRLRQGKSDAVVVALVRGACGGCFTAQPAARAQQVRAGELPVSCEYCGRMIVGVAGPPPA